MFLLMCLGVSVPFSIMKNTHLAPAMWNNMPLILVNSFLSLLILPPLYFVPLEFLKILQILEFLN